jgi:hypothetical protein
MEFSPLVHTPVATHLPWRDILSVEALVLLYVHAHPDETQREVAKALNLTPTWISQSLRRLEKAGIMVVYRGLAEDGRRAQYRVRADALLGDDSLGVMTVGQFVRAMAVAGSWLAATG